MLEVLEAAQGSSTNAIIREGLENVRAMLYHEDEGWDLFVGGHGQEDGGLNLDDLKAWSRRINEGVVGSAWIGRGFRLRHSSYWQGNIQYDGIPSEGRGNGRNVQALIDDPINQRAFFGKQAHMRREKRLFTDGLAIWIGDDATKKLEIVPLVEITDVLTDPDHDDIIYAYKREWTRRQRNGKPKNMVRWYFVDAYKDLQTTTISVNGKDEKVETGFTAFDMHANPVDGWKFGSPDALAAWIWNDIGKRLYMDGVDVSEAMASIIFSVSGQGAKGGQNAANVLANGMGPGSSAVVGGNGNMAALSTAGKGYDFSTVREVISIIAASLDVSNIALTANPGDAGSSYGSAQVLNLPDKLSALVRRDEHAELDLRVLKWMAGPGKARDGIKVYFRSLDDGADLYRRVQAVVLKWQQGLMKPEDAVEQIDDIFGIPSGYEIPEGILIPNNRDSLPRRDIDTDSKSGGAQAAAPTQGRGSNDGGGMGGARPTDTRNDTIS